MPIARLPAAFVAATLAASAPPALFAQVTNPSLRGAIATPRAALQARPPATVRERTVSGFSPYPIGCGDTNGTVYINAEVEAHVAINPLNPNHLLGSWQQDRYSNGAARGLVSATSFDGGVTWTPSTLPFSTCTGGPYSRATDPWVAFGPDGTAHQIALSVTGTSFTPSGVNAILASRSTDGGITWAPPVTILEDGGNLFNDKETLTADPTDARFVYAVWDRLVANANGPTLFARSTDGGRTWEPAREIHVPAGRAQTIGNLIRVLPDGTLVNLFTGISPGPVGSAAISLFVMRSGDKGATWSAPIFVSTMGAVGARDPATNAPIRDGAILAQMAVAPNGTLHVVWQDARFSAARDAIALARSADGGLTWSTPVRVNSTPTVPAFTPQVHVRADGVIGVVYYDLRSDTADPATLMTDFWLARSADGINWTETRVSPPFDISTAPVAGGYFLGDYVGLVSAGADFIAFYTRTTGNAANRTDVIAARISGAAVAPASKETRADGVSAYRAEALPAGDPGPEFWRSVSDNVARSLEWRLLR